MHINYDRILTYQTCISYLLLLSLSFILRYSFYYSQITARMPVTKLSFKPINFHNLTLLREHSYMYSTNISELTLTVTYSLCHPHAWLELIIVD